MLVDYRSIVEGYEVKGRGCSREMEVRNPVCLI